MGTTFNDNAVFTKSVAFSGSTQFLSTVVIPSGTITNAMVIASAEIDDSKLQHRHSKQYVQDGGSDVVSATKLIHLARAAGELHSVKVRPITAPTGGDKQFTVDVQKAADASGSFATLLAAVVTVDNTSVDNTQQSGTLAADPSISAGDVLEIIITASGSTGSQGQGVIVEIQINESGL